MADRTVRVRLEAVTSVFKRQMEDAARSTQQLADKVGGLDRLGGKMQAVGGMMTAGVTLPLAAAGGAAVKMSTDFETAFASMVGLAGVPQGEIEGLKESVLELAGETGRAPRELADALYFAASAGLDAAGAMDAVEVAAKGAAVGMGSTEEIVGLVASAVASYGEENINAAQAVDILTATIREGRAEPSELAGTLGRVLPIASQLGVSFDEVGGAVAYLSNVFGDTNRTVTATQGLLVKLVSPSKQGRDMLEQMGTSVEELHAAIDQDGLLGALELLKSKGFDQNNQALRTLFDDIEGYQAALALLNDESGSLAGILSETADAAGATDSAFATMAETAGFKNAQAFAELQTALISIGDVLVPLVTDVAQFAGKLLDLFNNLPGPAQNTAIAFGAMLAAVGPIASIGGRMLTNWQTMGRAFDRAATGAYDLAGGMGRIARAGAVVGILYGVGQALDTIDAPDRADLNGLQRSLLDLGEAGRIGGEGASAFGDDFGKLTSAIERISAPSVATQVGHTLDSLASVGGLLGSGTGQLRDAQAVIDDLDDALSALTSTDPEAAAAALDALRDAIGDESFDRLLPLLDGYKSALDGVDVSSRTAAGGIDEAAGATEDLIPPVDEAIAAEEALEDAIKGVTNALRSQFDPFFAATDAMLANQQAQRKVEEAHWAVTTASDELAAAIEREGEESWAARDAAYKLEGAERDLVDAQREAGRSALEVSSAMTELKMRVEDGSLKIQEGYAELDRWVEQGLITKEQARILKEEMFLAALAAEDLGNKEPKIRLYMDSSAFWVEWNKVRDEIGWGREAGIRLSVGGGGGIAAASGGLVEGPRGYGDIVPFLLEPGEVVIPRHIADALRHGNPASFGAIASASTSNVRNTDVTINVVGPPAAAMDERTLLSTAAWALAGR